MITLFMVQSDLFKILKIMENGLVNWFTLTVASVLALVSFYFLTKKALNSPHVDSRFYGSFMQIATGLVSLPIALLYGFHFQVTQESLLLLVGMAIAYVIGPSLYYIGLQKVDLSETTILDSSGVIWSLILGAILLGEQPTWNKVIGIVFILAAILIIAIKKGNRVHFTKYQILILIAPFFYSLAAVFDNRLLTFSNPISYLSLSFLIAGCCMFLTNIGRLKTAGLPMLRDISIVKILIVNGFFLTLTYTLVYAAYNLGGEVSRMYPIQQVESVIVPLLSIYILKEKDRIPQKIVAAVVGFLGVIIIGS